MDRTQNQGSVSSLRHLVYPLSIFIADAAAPWNGTEKSSVLAKELCARRWLSRQALRYGVPLSFHDGGNFGLYSDVPVDAVPHAYGTRHEYTHWVRHVLSRVGWVSPVALFNLHCLRNRLPERTCDPIRQHIRN
jgi:hypothetical protein